MLVATLVAAALTAPPPVAAEGPAATDIAPPPPDALVLAVGGASHLGDPAGLALQGPLVSIASTPSGGGYWLAGSDGGVFAHGAAPWLGSIPQVLPAGVPLAEPVVEIIAHPSGRGYWLVASDGGVFSYGAAGWFGSVPQVLPVGVRLAAPISAATATPSGDGYWLLGADGGVFTFGDAGYHGALPEIDPPGGVDAVAIVASATGAGYRIHLRDGRSFGFGDAPTAPNPGAGVAPLADVDGSGAATVAAGVTGALRGRVDLDVDPRSGIASVAVAPRGAWVVRNSVGPVVSVWQSGGLTDVSLDAAIRAARAAGAQLSVSHGGALDYVSLRRGGRVVDAAPAGWRINMRTLVLDPIAADVLVGGPAARALARDEIVVGRRAADRRGARRGDVIELYGWNDETAFVTVGHVAEAVEIGEVELLVGPDVAARLGFHRPTAVVMWAFDAAALDGALGALPTGERWLTVNRSWVETGRDATLPTTVLKDVAGEPAYLPGGPGDDVVFRQEFVDAHIVAVDLPILGTIRCHRVVAEPLVDVFATIEAEGLASAIDVADTRAHGGCFHPRTIRGSSGGSLSRHSWGVAIDVNPRTNAFGATPTMHPRVVEIFRERGFAWGGSWVRPDGMHFEWVGTA